jgi:hypothetical protein
MGKVGSQLFERQHALQLLAVLLNEPGGQHSLLK